jgi:hypothetical protein
MTDFGKIVEMVFIATTSGVVALLVTHKFWVTIVAAIITATGMVLGLFWILPGSGWIDERLPVVVLSFLSLIIAQLWAWNHGEATHSSKQKI